LTDLVPLVHSDVDSTSKPQGDAGIASTSTMIVHANFLLIATKFGEITHFVFIYLIGWSGLCPIPCWGIQDFRSWQPAGWRRRPTSNMNMSTQLMKQPVRCKMVEEYSNYCYSDMDNVIRVFPAFLVLHDCTGYN